MSKPQRNPTRPRRKTYPVLVENLPFNTTEKSLSSLFAELGEIEYIQIRNSDRKPDFKRAFIHYLRESDADEAVSKRNGIVWDGVQLMCRKYQRRDKIIESPGNKAKMPECYSSDASRFSIPSSPVLPFGQTNFSLPQEEDVVIQSVKDIICFHAIKLTDLPKLNDILSQLEDYCPSTERLTSPPLFRKVYATQFSVDKRWYRCRALKELGGSKWMVQYCDFGNCEAVEFSNIVTLPSELATIPSLAFSCRFHNLQEIGEKENAQLHKEGLEYVKKTLECATVKINVLNSYGASYVKECIKEDKNIVEELISLGYARRQNSPSPSVPGLQTKGDVISDSSNYLQSSSSISSLSGESEISFPLQMQRMYANDSKQTSLSSSLSSNTQSPVSQSPVLPNFSPPYLNNHQRPSLLKTPPVLVNNFNSPNANPLLQQRKICANQNKVKTRDKGVNVNKLSEISQDDISAVQKLSTQRDNLILQLSQERTRREALEKEVQMLKEKEGMNFLIRVQAVLNDWKVVSLHRDQLSSDPNHLDCIDRIMLAKQNCFLTEIYQDESWSEKAIDDTRKMYLEKQDSIRKCSNKEELQDLIEERNNVKEELTSKIQTFLKVLDSIPIKEKVESLKKHVSDLEQKHPQYFSLDFDRSNNPTSVDELYAFYKKLKVETQEVLKEKREESSLARQHFLKALRTIEENCCSASDVSCEKNLFSAVYLEACISNFQQTLQAEILSFNSVYSAHDPHLCSLVRKLHEEFSSELHKCLTISELKDKFMMFHQELCSGSEVPYHEITALQNLRQTVKKLKSQLRHSLADMDDIDESNKEELQNAMDGINDLRKKIQDVFLQESYKISELAKAQEKLYPEMALMYPELDLETFMKYDGLLKPGWERSMYSIEGLTRGPLGNASKTKFAGRDVAIKEVLAGKEVKDEILQKAVKYNKVANASRSLMIIHGAFFDKDDHVLYIQVPYIPTTLAECMESSSPSRPQVWKILWDVLNGLNNLHSAGFVYGCLHPSMILMGEDMMAVLDLPDFSQNSSKPGNIRLPAVNGISFIPPEYTKKDAELSVQGDMYAFGCLMLWLYFPMKEFASLSSGIPCLESDAAIPEMNTVRCLLKQDPKLRLTARETLTMQPFVNIPGSFIPSSLVPVSQSSNDAPCILKGSSSLEDCSSSLSNTEDCFIHRDPVAEEIK